MPNRQNVREGQDPQHLADLQAAAAAESARHQQARLADLTQRTVELNAEVRRLRRENADQAARIAELEAEAPAEPTKKTATKKAASRKAPGA